MLKIIIASTAVRKIVIFSLVFVIAGAAMGVQLAMTPDLQAAGSGSSAGSARALTIHDPQGVRPEVLTGEEGSDRLEELLQPMSAGTDRLDSVVFREPSPPAAARSLPPDADQPLAETVPEDKPDTGFVALSQLPLSEELQRYTWERCQEQQISYSLVLALMWRESRFETQAVNLNYNGTQDSGIMQINDVNKAWLHRELAVDNLLDPHQNIDAGTEILGRFIHKYGVQNALLAYQYGESGMRRKLAQGVTTNRQIEQLYEKQAEYQTMLEQAAQ